MTVRLDPDHVRGPLLTSEYTTLPTKEANTPTLEVGLALPTNEANTPTLEVGLALPTNEATPGKAVSRFSMEYHIRADQDTTYLIKSVEKLVGPNSGFDINFIVTVGGDNYLANMRIKEKTATISVDSSAIQSDDEPLISTLARAGEDQFKGLESRLKTSRLDRNQTRLNI